MTTHWQRDERLALADVSYYAHRGFKTRFSWVFRGIPHISDVGLKSAIGAEYEFFTINRNVHRSSSIAVQHRLRHVGKYVRSRRHGARDMVAVAIAGRRPNPIAKGVAAVRDEAAVHRSIAVGEAST